MKLDFILIFMTIYAYKFVKKIKEKELYVQRILF